MWRGRKRIRRTSWSERNRKEWLRLSNWPVSWRMKLNNMEAKKSGKKITIRI
jgi:hypothetical protein